MTTTPGTDEHRIRSGLRALGVSYAPQPPAADPDAWWDELYADEEEDEPAGRTWLRLPTRKRADPEDDEEPEDDWEDAAGDDETTPRAVRRSKRAPGRRAQEAYAGLDPRMQWLLIASAQAGMGWFLGLESAMRGWIVSCGHDTGTSTALILGMGMVGAGGFITYCTRLWWPPLAWVCRVPFATALLALALYAPGGTS